MAITTHPVTLDKTFALIAAGGQLSSESNGAGHEAARRELAVFLEHFMKAPNSIINKAGVLNREAFDSTLKDYQRNHDNLKVDGIVGQKTLLSLKLNLSIFAAINREKEFKPRGVSCSPVGLANFPGHDCPELEKFMASIAEKPTLSPQDVLQLSAVDPIRALITKRNSPYRS